MRSPPPVWRGVSLAPTFLWDQMLLSTALPEPQPARDKMLMHTQSHLDRNIRNVFWGAADAAFEE